ncbi:pre-mRNA-processing protein 40A-like isoform X2 [Prosopis cineraria]|uniref:pre-mRNA-processing protein 40A-like isoform X2 n=1 Tax=Prosopis cineraria TaxID=364024 RepID=UPI00241083B9|nr:pre-mRNA-processing protein 40A-like isoform X2 [Prosopis cineraria]
MSNNPQFPGLQPLRPPIMGSVEPPRNFAPPMPLQFRPAVPAQQSQQFISQHYPPLGPGVPLMNVGMPSQNQQPQFVQSIQQMPPRPGQQLPMSLPVARANMPIQSESMVPQSDSQTPNGYTPGLGGSGLPLSSSYTYAPSSYGQVQNNFSATSQYQAVCQTQTLTVSSGEQLRASISTASGTSLLSSGEQPSILTIAPSATNFLPDSSRDGSTDWIEHTSANGRRFYYNKKTKVSSWEKPFELMTPIERADASTNWKEYSSPDGRKYYYNKVTKESKWIIPEELKLAREQIGKVIVNGMEPVLNSHTQHSKSPTAVEATSIDNSSLTGQGEPSSPISVAPVVTMSSSNLHSEMTAGSSASPAVAPMNRTNVDEVEAPANTVTPSDSNMDETSVADVNTSRTPMKDAENVSSQDTLVSADGVPAEDKEDAKKDTPGEKTNEVALETKAVEPEPLVYANKMEAKNVFKALLESANVGSDWTWDRAMRVIINDKRYGALKSLGERKQVFNEFLNQKKKQEAEEKRMKLKKAREDFKKMLEESTELTSSTRWSKAVSLFENDDRFKAVERDRDRRDLFDSFMEELVNKERAKAQEERKRNILEYRKFLEACDFIKASTQWRKVQDRLEADERCFRLEKIDRLEIFQDYLHDLEKEEEEQKKIHKEELRKAERRNRDEFRKLMEEDIAMGTLTAKTHWRDYYVKVKDLPAYVAVASNTSGSTPKDLFEDVSEELEKQYHEDKTRVKDAVKLGKITLSSTWTVEDFKTTILKDISSPPISDVNIKLVFDELLERAREKEEKEAKKRKRLADDFFHLLYSIKDINASSKWEDFRSLIEDCQEFRSIGDETYCKEIFEEYLAQLKEEAKESERKRKEEKAKKEKEREDREKRKGKQRREKEKEEGHKRDKADSDNMDTTEIQSSKETKRSEDDSRKQRKQHQSPEHVSHETDKERTKKSRGHSSDRKKSSRHASGQESDSEVRHKKHKKDHRSSSHRDCDYGELEDGEFGDDGERW